MARVAGQSLTVSCGGTVGGCAGMVFGLVAGIMVGFALGGWAAIVLAPVGMILGLFGGMRLALSSSWLDPHLTRAGTVTSSRQGGFDG